MASRWTAFGIASWVLPSMSRESRTLGVRRASSSSWPGSVMWTVGTVAVDHGGNLAVTADAAGGALAELGAGLGGELDLGHVHSS